MPTKTSINTQPVKSQSDRFIEAAHAHDCDEDEDAFKARLGVIARQKPKSTGES